MEEWTRWEPVFGLPGRFCIKDLRMSKNGLMLELISKSNEMLLELLFGFNIEAYRCINESWVFTIFGMLNDRYGDDFYGNWSLFKITNSNYAKSLSPLSAGVSESEDFDHFCIVDNDFVLDVLTLDTPTVKIIE